MFQGRSSRFKLEKLWYRRSTTYTKWKGLGQGHRTVGKGRGEGEKGIGGGQMRNETKKRWNEPMHESAESDKKDKESHIGGMSQDESEPEGTCARVYEERGTRDWDSPEDPVNG
ncbi:hypothetical protein BDR06DRAFT_968134 [Suillus hirtellus]|nr:hypothetical protein BDR06DRAFT_968134 [Suillus hirtellus]